MDIGSSIHDSNLFALYRRFEGFQGVMKEIMEQIENWKMKCKILIVF